MSPFVISRHGPNGIELANAPGADPQHFLYLSPLPHGHGSFLPMLTVLAPHDLRHVGPCDVGQPGRFEGVRTREPPRKWLGCYPRPMPCHAMPRKVVSGHRNDIGTRDCSDARKWLGLGTVWMRANHWAWVTLPRRFGLKQIITRVFCRSCMAPETLQMYSH